VASDLKTVAAAYMSHAGYEQARTTTHLPAETLDSALAGVLVAQDAALTRLSQLVFTKAERGPASRSSNAVDVESP